MSNYHRIFVTIAIFAFSLLATSPSMAAGPIIQSIVAQTRTVGLYEKLELRVDLLANYSNPFNPNEIDLWAEFTSPTGKSHSIWGFYNPSGWQSLWMIRFSPTEIGQWKYVLHVKDRDGTVQSEPHNFQAIESVHHGFIGVANNKQYLKYTDGSSFYGVGMWYNDSYEQFGEGKISELGLDDLQHRGVNFISFFPTPLETMGTGLGRYDQNRCGRLDQLFDWCEARDIHISWNIWFHSYISEAVWGGGNARYRNNPYRLASEAVDFYGSEEAWEYQEWLYRYMIARWGYSRALYLWFVVDEINGTEGWTEGDQKDAEAWCKRVHEFFHEHDPYHRPTTGTQSGGIGQWWPGGYKIFDIAAREIYEAQGHPMPQSGKIGPEDESPLRYSYSNYATQIQNLRRGFDKPAIIGECGWDHTYYEPGMPGYLAMYHNALWVSLATGACTTPFWWSHSERINDSMVTNQLLYFSRFLDDIDLTRQSFEPVDISAGSCDAWALKNDALVLGWVVNPKTSLARETFTVTGLPDGDFVVSLYRTWRGSYLEPQTVSSRDGELTVAIPELLTTGGHASHIGNDIAFKIQAAK